MKRIIATGFITAIAVVGLSGTANAAPADAACFGQVHKAVNAGALEADGISNVGDLVKALGGQGKNAAAKALFCS
ncbi:hypothetical protein [Demequina sp. SO4-18]|uniref:hypothetical protein n=1 Tax=Demequina sp. SO4-18 TaxID=3401026 RepID=UPI003B5C0A11